MKNFKTITLSLLVLVLSTTTFAQQFEPLAIDAKVRYGKLDNGLTYYIRHNTEPKERAEFHIAQNVGAILELDHQNGLAHFLEHMAFNGTKNFPDKAIINYFEKIGVKFGYDINAYTSLDETVYRLSNVPTVRETIVDSALLVLHDWSGFISLHEKEIDAERGVILEEWRSGNNAGRRMLKKTNELVFAGSQYAKRDVIGDTAIINNFTYQALRDYYHKWYRPDQQAIVIVGDIDVDKMEKKIKEVFSDITKKENFGERPIYNIDDNKEPIVAVVTDPEASGTRIQIQFKKDKLPKEVSLSMAGYMQGVMNRIIASVMNERFEEMSIQANAPFINAGTYYGGLVKSKDAFVGVVIPKEGQEIEGFEALMLELEKMKRFGFTNSEVERAKTNILSSYEKSYNERDNQKSQDLAEEYIRHYLDDEPIPGIETEYNLVKMVFPHINADAVNQLAKSYITDDNIIISVNAPEKAEVKVPIKEQLLAAIEKAQIAELTAKEEEEANRPLLAEIPTPGKVVSVTENKDINTTEMTLSNGIKLVFKPTTFKKDEISMNAFSEGGLSKVKNVDDLVSGSLATAIVSSNGIADFNTTELGRVLTGKVVGVSPYIRNYGEGLSGSSSVKDFETFLQLVYLHFTAPRKDDNSFEALSNMLRAALSNVDKDPRKAFNDTLSLVTTNYDPRTLIQSLEMVDKIDQDKALAIYKERFANPADFTFAFVGNINPQDKETQRLLATYIGGLKTSSAKESWDDVYRHTPKGKINRKFSKEMETKQATNRIQYTADMPYTIENQLVLNAIGSILTMRYMESIREKEGGSYGVGVAGFITNTPAEQAKLVVQFNTDPLKQEKLIGIVYAEIEKIIKEGPLSEDLSKVKENMQKEFKQELEDNGWWLGTLKTYYQDKLNYTKDYETAIRSLSSETIQSTLKKIVEQGNVIEVVMMPQ